jgi:hypothetical protein
MDGRRFALKLLVIMTAIVLIGFALEVAWDVTHAVDPATGAAVKLTAKDLTVTPAMVRAVASPFARAYNNILALLLTFIGLAIPLTANMYTPKLIEIFVKDKVNITVLSMYAILTAHSILAVTLSFDHYAGQIPFWVDCAGAILGWTMILPYYFYVLTFLNPGRIIALVRDNVIQGFRASTGAQNIRAAQEGLNQRIQHLGSVLLKAVDRADRDVVIDAIAAHMQLIRQFRDYKGQIPPKFFEVGGDIMVGSSSGALKIINGAQIWVEQKILGQIILAYTGALGKMPDGVSAIADALKEEADYEARHGNPQVLELMIRVMNVFMREAVKKKDPFAIYNVFYNYKSLTRRLMDDAPARLPDLARYFRYYADYAKMQGLPFIYELASYEIAELAEYAYSHNIATASSLVDALLSFEGVASSVRLVKSRAILAGFFHEKRMEAELLRIRDSLAGVPRAVLDQAEKELMSTHDRIFWEVTDRGTNFDFVEESRKASIRELYDQFKQLPAAAPAAAAGAPAGAASRG